MHIYVYIYAYVTSDPSLQFSSHVSPVCVHVFTCKYLYVCTYMYVYTYSDWWPPFSQLHVTCMCTNTCIRPSKCMHIHVYVHVRCSNRWSLQRTATHCNTLQHTATHCNTPICTRKMQQSVVALFPATFQLYAYACLYTYICVRIHVYINITYSDQWSPFSSYLSFVCVHILVRVYRCA